MCLLVARSDVNTAGSAAPEGCMGRMEMMMMPALQCNATRLLLPMHCAKLYICGVFSVCAYRRTRHRLRGPPPLLVELPRRGLLSSISPMLVLFSFFFFFKGCDLGFNSRIRASISTQRDIFIAKMVHQESGLNFLTVDVTFRRISWAPSLCAFLYVKG